ncbi:glycosyltransferase [Microbacterium sp. KSW2-21]|uniref:Glycosyltransferase n=1 Tax=Microbacterium algihabitans TaxID=3075992 RepID=A0ABU3RVE5_9MICO|nr:glycosyltransferase [Microbacterium sp. KSW2-21]MDU0326866.1 glycosyltransferase [Microbacterium sp. KSW2-21]
MGRLYQRLVVSGLRNAGLIISVSRTTASDVARFTSRHSPVLLNPLAKTLTPSDSAPKTPYLLVVSNTGWRKRRWLAIEAWLAIRAASSMELRLVIVGNGHDLKEENLLTALEPRVRNSVEIKSHLSDGDLADLYSSATLLLQLSKYEGFAWPIIEANSVGTLAICADEPILRETGEGNFFVDADGLGRVAKSGWNDAMRLAGDVGIQSKLRARANTFSIENFDRGLGEILHASLKDANGF